MNHQEITVRKSVDINARPSRVWEIIVSPHLWKRWMHVTPELERGHRLELGSKVLWKDKSGKTYLTGTTSAFEPNRKLVLELQDISWKRAAAPGEVTYALTLSEEGGRTHLDFRLGDLSIDPDAQQWRDAYVESRELEVIKEIAETPLA